MNKISIIIPAYNAAKTVERTVRSVMASSIPVDVWVVDDGSTDSTGALLDRLAIGETTNRTTLHVLHQPNGGAYQARLAALSRIETPFFGFVDADDTVDPKMFETLVDFAERERLDVVQAEYRQERATGRRRVLDGRNAIWREVVRPVLWEGRDASFIWDKVYRRQYDFAAFDPTDHVTNWDDLIFNLQFFTRVTRMGFVEEALYRYADTCGSAARKFRWRLVGDFRETLRMRRKMARAYGVRPWGWLNLRWTLVNLRNLLVIGIRTIAGRARNLV